MKDLSEKLKELYTSIPWPDDPGSERGKRYFVRTVQSMEALADFPWVEELAGHGKVKVLEICGGSGFGGIALGKVLEAKNVDVEILITDLREDALERARNWGKASGINVKTMVLDAKEIHKLQDRFDIVLIFGLSTPHFNPWEMVKLLSSISTVLNPGGVLAIEESDRRFRIFINSGYKWTLGEGDEDKLVLSTHSGYDVLRGTVKRTYASLNFAAKPITIDMYIWGIAELGALIWTFFEDVELIPLSREFRYFIVARKPRKELIKPSEIEEPGFLKRKDFSGSM